MISQEEARRRPREQTQSTTEEQQTMDDKFKCVTSSGTPKTGLEYLVESFSLNSEDRVVSRKGKNRRPHPSFSKMQKNSTIQQSFSIFQSSGKKIRTLDLKVLESYFRQYVMTVNLVLDRVYKNPDYAERLAKQLSEFRGRAYNLLRGEHEIRYLGNQEFQQLAFERLHRNALEQAGRIILTDWTRRSLVLSAIEHFNSSPDELFSLLEERRIPSFLIRKVRDGCEVTKNNGAGYHYTLGVLRQLRFVLDTHILDSLGIKISHRGRQRAKVISLLEQSSPKKEQVFHLLKTQVQNWKTEGYPFVTPQLRSYSVDFSASTENTPNQGYWFTIDPEREGEILLHLKLPSGINGVAHKNSPYKSTTFTFRFLNWLSRASSRDRRKADDAEKNGNVHRSERLRFRSAMFQDMHEQLMNTIEFQHSAHKRTKMIGQKDHDSETFVSLDNKVDQSRKSRRSAPPRILLRGSKAILQIPFLSPNGAVSSKIFGEREYSTQAGVDRGIRAPVAISVEKEGSFEDFLITVGPLVEKRERLRFRASELTSQLDRKKNNWDKKRSGQSYPAPILKRERHVEALWEKFRRLDREIAHQVGSQTIWFCEEHRVKKLFFEDLRSFQARAGMKNLSWFLGVNLWGRIIETVRYMRESLGHSKYSVWTVNPSYTSQTCHQCGERGIRVAVDGSTSETKGGAFFYCSNCDAHYHADINAARNIIHVQQSSVVPGRTQ